MTEVVLGAEIEAKERIERISYISVIFNIPGQATLNRDFTDNHYSQPSQNKSNSYLTV